MMNKFVSIEELAQMQKDCGLPHPPTQFTYSLILAVSGKDADVFGSLGYQWNDKPHRLVYSACREIEFQEVIINSLRAENEKLKEQVAGLEDQIDGLYEDMAGESI